MQQYASHNFIGRLVWGVFERRLLDRPAASRARGIGLEGLALVHDRMFNEVVGRGSPAIAAGTPVRIGITTEGATPSSLASATMASLSSTKPVTAIDGMVCDEEMSPAGPFGA